MAHGARLAAILLAITACSTGSPPHPLFKMNTTTDTPRLRIEDCPSAAPTFGDTVLYLRGTMNNWGALDDYAFQYSCDAYYLNVKLSGRHEFKLADAAWSPATTSEAHALDFNGEHTLRAIVVAGRIQLSLGPKTFVDPNALPVEHPVAQGLRHDSRAPADKRPFGTVPAGTTVEFGVSAPVGVQRLTLVIESRRLEGNQEVLEYSEQARVPMQRVPDGSGHERWSASHHFADKGVHGYWFDAEVDGRHYAVQNNMDAVFWTREKGSNGLSAVGVKPARASAIRRFRLTVYDPAFTVPDWAADAVYYYIFPDRYRNGNPANDPKPSTRRYQNHGVELHANWNDKPWKPGTGDGSDAVYNNDFFGGDLAGIIDKLDDIRDLGANTIYMTPVFEAASNHKYDTADYHRIDPAFGSNADFERLTAEAAKRGIRVIPDASLNHVGSDSIYFNRYGNFGQQGAFQNGRVNPASPYAGWFRFEPNATEADKQYRGWVGVADLPELDKSSRSFRDFAYGAKDSVMKVWLDRGAAGWRMDVAPWVPDDFWREWRAAIKAHRPDALTIAETWFDASKYFVGDMFDSTMNYVFRNAVLEYAAGGDARVLYGNLELLREAYPPQAFHALMNLLSTHDQARSLYVLGGPDGASPEAMALAKRRLLLAVQFQMAYPGAPAVYYGDEVGVSGGDDPYNRATYPWLDRGGRPDLALRAEFKRLIAMRDAHPVLRRGSLAAPVHVDAHSIVLARQLGREHALTATNNAEHAQALSIALPAGAPQQWRDAQGGEVFTAKDGRLGFTLPALGGRVLLATAP